MDHWICSWRDSLIPPSRSCYPWEIGVDSGLCVRFTLAHSKESGGRRASGSLRVKKFLYCYQLLFFLSFFCLLFLKYTSTPLYSFPTLCSLLLLLCITPPELLLSSQDLFSTCTEIILSSPFSLPSTSWGQPGLDIIPKVCFSPHKPKKPPALMSWCF